MRTTTTSAWIWWTRFPPTAENTRKPLKKWVFVVAGLAVILIGVVILLANLMPKNYVAQVDGAKDKVVVQADLEGGGHAVLGTSAKADAGSIALTALPRIDGSERYTVWLIEAESDRATRLATVDVRRGVGHRGLQRGRQDRLGDGHRRTRRRQHLPLHRAAGRAGHPRRQVAAGPA